MKFVRGKYIGKGIAFVHSLGFPLGKRVTGLIRIKGDAATAGVRYGEERGIPIHWCGRSNTTTGEESFNDGVRFVPGGILIGADSRINTVDAVYYFLLILDSGDNDFELGLACGNSSPLLPRDYLFRIIKQLIFLEIKRDSTAPPVVATAYGANTSTAEGGGVLGSNNFVDSLGVGKATVHAGYSSAQTRVNQLQGPTALLGEGHELLAIFDSPDVKVTPYDSDNVAGREIVIADASNPAEAVLVYRLATGGGSMRMKTLDMPGSTAAPMTAAALQPNDFAFSADGTKIIVGSTTSAINGSGVGIKFVVVAFLASGFQKSFLKAPGIKVSSKRAVLLDGTTDSGVDCGIDDSLMINGPGTWTWFGVVRSVVPGGSGTYEVPLMHRGNAYSAVGGASWGLGALRQSTGKSWGGPFVQGVVTTRWANALADCRDICRTGILLPIGRPFALTHVHRGAGQHEYWLDKRLVYQRNLDLTISPLWGGNAGAVSGAPEDIAAYPGGAPNIQSASGHRYTIGARSNGGTAGSFSANLNGLIYEVPVSRAAWTADEIQTTHERMLYGSAAPEVTRDLVGYWSGPASYGNRMTDLIGLNHGAITGGRVITL